MEDEKKKNRKGEAVEYLGAVFDCSAQEPHTFQTQRRKTETERERELRVGN